MPSAGRYHIARKIADGGMAEIFLGTQHGAEGFERPVVLKRILAPLVADPQFRNMLIDEAHVAMGLNHSNIVQVLDLGHVHGRYFLVMEFVDGWDLGQIVARAANASFPLPPEIILYVAAEICRALAYAHSRSRDGQPLALVHRDVSPQNVLISEQGEVKLTDFGIAKAMGRRERTHQGVIKGKLAFMSPEQASGFVLDNRSDLFSLGTILYQLFTGRRPFDAPTDMESIVRVRECRFAPPEEAKSGLHPEMAAIIRHAMQAQPADRFQSADEMLLAIENIQRTVYKPAGQTELKRWLSDLHERDHVITAGRNQTASIPSLDEELDVGEGADVVFDQSDLMEISQIMRGMQPTIPIPTQVPDTEDSGPATDKTAMAVPPPVPHPLPPPLPRPTKPGSGRVAIALVLLAGLSAAGWMLFGGKAQEPERPAPSSPPKAKHSPPTTTTIPEAPKKPAPTPAAAIDATPSPTPADTKQAEQLAAAAALAAASQEEEEDLLKNAEPESIDRVIDEDEGLPERKPRKATKASVAAPLAPVSVHIVSTPEGAVISLGRRVFGRAPLNLRFRPGITYELTFVKKGYQSATKHLSVRNRANQSLKVALKKKAPSSPPPKKSLFRRIFGR